MKVHAPNHLEFNGKYLQPGEAAEMHQDDAEAAIAEGWTVDAPNEVEPEIEPENETELEESIDDSSESEI